MPLLTIGDHDYEPVGAESYTLEYDIHVETILRETGIADLMEMREALAPAELTAEFVKRLSASNRVGEFLAALVRPAGKVWTKQAAATAARQFAGATSRTDKDLLYGVMFTGLAGFFGSGPRWSPTSH